MGLGFGKGATLIWTLMGQFAGALGKWKVVVVAELGLEMVGAF